MKEADDSRPSDTLLGAGFAIAALLLLAGAFFTRVTKFSAGGVAFETTPQLPPATKEVVDQRVETLIEELKLSPREGKRLEVGMHAVARNINAATSVDAETVADLAARSVAKSLKFM